MPSPTQHAPGSPGKVADLAGRARLRLPLFAAGDAAGPAQPPAPGRAARHREPREAAPPPPRPPRVRPPRLLCSRQVARRLGVSKRTLWRLVAKGVFPQPVRYNRKLVRWKSADVERYIDAL